MTIALGIPASDGLVIAADTEESISGYMKRSQPKITTVLIRRTSTGKFKMQAGQHPGNVIVIMGTDDDASVDIAITGAGNAGYLESVMERLSRAFAKTGGKKSTPEELQELIEISMRKFYKEHIIPFSAMPYHERPEVAMLVGYCRHGVKALFETELTAVRLSYGSAVVGSGQMLAKTLLNRFCLGTPLGQPAAHTFNIRMAQLLATYVIFHVKESIDGCGKATTIETLPNTITALTDDQIKRLEEVFRRYVDDEKEALIYAFASDGSSVTTDKATNSLKQLRTDCMSVLGDATV